MEITEFQRKVYEIVKKIPKGKAISYKEIAETLNSSPRAVGQALKRNQLCQSKSHVIELYTLMGKLEDIKELKIQD